MVGTFKHKEKDKVIQSKDQASITKQDVAPEKAKLSSGEINTPKGIQQTPSISTKEDSQIAKLHDKEGREDARSVDSVSNTMRDAANQEIPRDMTGEEVNDLGGGCEVDLDDNESVEATD